MRSLLVLDGYEGEQQPVQGQNGLLGTLQLPAGVQQAQHKAPECIKVAICRRCRDAKLQTK